MEMRYDVIDSNDDVDDEKEDAKNVGDEIVVGEPDDWDAMDDDGLRHFYSNDLNLQCKDRLIEMRAKNSTTLLFT